MASKSTPRPKPERTYLRVPREEARAEIQAAIERGRLINPVGDFEKFKEDRTAWNTITRRMLCHIFSDDSQADRFLRCGIIKTFAYIPEGGIDHAKEIKEAIDNINASIQFLSALLDSLKYFDEATAPELASDPARPKIGQTAKSIIYHITGDNPRVVVGSHDQSTNVVNIERNEVFAKLRGMIQQSVPEEDRDGLLVSVNAMEQNVGKPGFYQKYQDFMTLAANHVTVFAPMFPALAQLIGQYLS